MHLNRSIRRLLFSNIIPAWLCIAQNLTYTNRDCAATHPSIYASIESIEQNKVLNNGLTFDFKR